MDLRSHFPTFKVEYDRNRYVIRCRFGTISEADGVMTATVDRTLPASGRLVALPCIIAGRIEADRITAQFAAEDFATVAKIMQPRIRRRLSGEHRRKLVEAGRPFRKHGSERPQVSPGIVPAA